MAEKGPEWTPGPWRVQEPADDYTHIVLGPSGYFVTSLAQLEGNPTKANARLIAAAPSLWHACVGLLESLEDAARNNPEAWLEFISEIAPDIPLAMAAASAAIQKAIGEYKARPVVDFKEIH